MIVITEEVLEVLTENTLFELYDYLSMEKETLRKRILEACRRPEATNYELISLEMMRDLMNRINHGLEDLERIIPGKLAASAA